MLGLAIASPNTQPKEILIVQDTGNITRPSMEDYAQELLNDRSCGAAELARRALQMITEYACDTHAANGAELIERVEKMGERLAGLRTNMAPIRNLIERWRATLKGAPLDNLESTRAYAVGMASELRQKSLKAAGDIARHARRAIGANRMVLTHSISSTVVEVMRAMKEDGVTAVVTEARPLLEGLRMAELLTREGIPTTLITDAQMGLYAGKVDCVLVGADSVLADGTLINKAGTYLMALAAREAGLPFYVACETFKLDARGLEDLELEEGDPAELGAQGVAGLTVRNLYFEPTPPRLITGWITELGVVTSAEKLSSVRHG